MEPIVQRIVFLLCLSLLSFTESITQSLTLSLPEVNVDDGQTVSVPLTVADFDSIVSLQLSINWNTDIATYVEFELGELPLLAIGDFQADQGELRLSWFDNMGDGRTLADGSTIATLTFTAMGEPGDFTDLIFSGTPLEVQIFRATGVPGIFTPIDLNADDGRISIASPLGFSIESNDVACFGESTGSATVSLAVNPGDYTLSWTGPDNFSATDLQLNDLSAGTYFLSITDSNGEVVFTYELVITQPTAPLVLATLQVEDASCEGTAGNLLATANGGTAPYSYTLNGDENDNGNFTELIAGDYSLTITDASGCTLALDTVITSPALPQLELPATVSLCDEIVQIGTDEIGSYVWSTGATTDSIAIEAPGVYSLTVTNAEGCTAMATTEATVGTPPVAVLANDFLETCPGDSLQLEVSGGTSYQWLSGEALSANDIANPTATPLTTNTYTVAVANNCGTDTLRFDLLVYDILATAGPDTCIAPGDPVQLQASGGIFYTWEANAAPVSDPTVANPTAEPKDSTTYRVAITDINGCVTIDEVLVLVANDPVSSIIPYNFISPNGDGLNDALEFGEISKFGTNTLKIYNRWGDLVYQKINYQSDEDRFSGMYKGERLPAGNYFYILAFRQGEVKQTLTLVWE